MSCVSCIVMMSSCMLCTSFYSSSILFLQPFILLWSMTMFCPLVDCLCFVGDGMLCWVC